MESAGTKCIIFPIPHVLAKTRQCGFLFGPNDRIYDPARSVPSTLDRNIRAHSEYKSHVGADVFLVHLTIFRRQCWFRLALCYKADESADESNK
jgi:hypothetical protein